LETLNFFTTRPGINGPFSGLIDKIKLMPSKKIKTPLVEDRYFHIYNRGNNRERIFEQIEDYQFFIEKYREIVDPFVNTYAYCLLPNHFHFLIKVEPYDSNIMSYQPSHLFRKFFQAYAIWYNKKQSRRGSLFTKYYRRIEVTSDEYLKQVVFYIHRNPVKHGLTSDLKSYPFSSFTCYSNYSKTWISREEALAWFENDLIMFLEFHNSFEETPDMRDFIIDEV
jgi:REP element-mobilizing transposase RayT